MPLAALTAIKGLRDVGSVRAGQRVLIVDASGGVGSFAVQIAKAFGASVTVVCSSGNVELVRSLGADRVIDCTREDGTHAGRMTWSSSWTGRNSPFACRRALAAKGTLIVSSGESEGRWIGPVERMLEAAVLSPFTSQRLAPFIATRSSQDLETVRELIECGKVTPLIDRT